MWKRKNKLLIKLIFVALLIMSLFIYLEVNFGPTIIAVAEAKTQLIATKVINEAVHRCILGKVEYNELMEIHKDSQDRIVLMMPNTVKINQLATEITLEIEKDLNQLKSQGFSLPLGLISGSSLLANTGPSLDIGIIPMGTINIEVVDEFVDAGINQTKHRILLDIRSNLKIVIPMMSSVVKVSMKVPVTESIIIGPVPQWYMNSDFNGNIPVPPSGVPSDLNQGSNNKN